MHPAARSSALVLVLSTAVVFLSHNPATGASSTISDPVGDVQVVNTASKQQEATVDITGVRYVVRDGRLVITTRVFDLARTPGNQFMETKVGTGDSSFSLVSMVGKRAVQVFTGTNLFRCKHSSTVARFDKNLVRQFVSVKCLRADAVQLRSSTVLARRNSIRITRDVTRRSGTVER